MASDLSLSDLASLFNAAYAGYHVPIHLDEAALAGMIAAQDLDRERSIVLFDDGAPVAFAMLGIRGDRGWIGGMGVIPSHRRMGLARDVMNRVLAAARGSGLSRVFLEVLEPNTAATALYRELGFAQTRWLEVLERPPGAPGGTTPDDGNRGAVRRVAPSVWLGSRESLQRTPLPWQRQPEVLERAAEGLEAAMVFDGIGRPRAGSVARFDPSRTLILSAGVADDATSELLTGCVAELLKGREALVAMMVNVPEDDPATEALRPLGFGVRIRQREMVLGLS